jgi:5'-3' exonuclease
MKMSNKLAEKLKVSQVTAGSVTPNIIVKTKSTKKIVVHPTRHSVGLPDNPDLDLALCIDGNNLFMRNYSIPNLATLTNTAGQKTGALFGTLKSVASEIRYWQPRYVYFVMDKNGSHRKKSLNAEYKANRPHGVKVMMGEQEEPCDIEARLEYESRQRQFKLLEEVLPHLGVCCCSVSGIEADDVIGNIITLHEHNVIVSTDTDFIQLHDGHNVIVYNPFTKRIRDVEEFGVIGPAYAVLKAVIGDPTDNVKGLDRVGWKTLIKWCDGHYPINISELFDMADARKDTNPLAQRIIDEWHIIDNNFKQICLHPDVTEMNSQLVLLMRSWRNRPVQIDMMSAMRILKREDIEIKFLMDMMSILQTLNR